MSVVFVATGVKPLVGNSVKFITITFKVFVATLRLLITFVRTCMFAVLSTIFVKLSHARRVHRRGRVGWVGWLVRGAGCCIADDFVAIHYYNEFERVEYYA